MHVRAQRAQRQGLGLAERGTVSLAAELRRNLDAMSAELKRNPSADVRTWLEQVRELRALAMTEMSCENVVEIESSEIRDIDVIAKTAEIRESSRNRDSNVMGRRTVGNRTVHKSG